MQRNHGIEYSYKTLRTQSLICKSRVEFDYYVFAKYPRFGKKPYLIIISFNVISNNLNSVTSYIIHVSALCQYRMCYSFTPLLYLRCMNSIHPVTQGSQEDICEES